MVQRKKRNSAYFIFIFLGMLTAFGPFVTDMYLPALPSMTGYFNTSISLVQGGLTASMLGLALGQLLFGPLSDKYGRRRPLFYSLILFMASTLLCILAPNIESFVILRFLQGIAASGGIVISRSIATDKFKQKNLSKALAIVGAINGIAPVAAPVIGGFMLNTTGWRGIFLALLFIGIVLFIFCLKFTESLSHPRRNKSNLLKTFKGLFPVLKNKKFLFYSLELSFALAVLFAYISSSPFVIQNRYGFGAFAFSLFFAANALAIGFGSTFSVRFKSETKTLIISCIGLVLSTFLIGLVLLTHAPFIFYEGLLFILCFMLGLSFTVATTRAMDAERARAGRASALLGSMGFLFGSIVSPIVGLGDTRISTSLTLFICALAASWAAYKAIRQNKK